MATEQPEEDLVGAPTRHDLDPWDGPEFPPRSEPLRLPTGEADDKSNKTKGRSSKTKDKFALRFDVNVAKEEVEKCFRRWGNFTDTCIDDWMNSKYRTQFFGVTYVPHGSTSEVIEKGGPGISRPGAYPDSAEKSRRGSEGSPQVKSGSKKYPSWVDHFRKLEKNNRSSDRSKRDDPSRINIIKNYRGPLIDQPQLLCACGMQYKSYRGNDYVVLTLFATAKGWRRLGLGEILVQKVKQLYWDANISKIIVPATLPAKPFWTSKRNGGVDMSETLVQDDPRHALNYRRCTLVELGTDPERMCTNMRPVSETDLKDRQVYAKLKSSCRFAKPPELSVLVGECARVDLLARDPDTQQTLLFDAVQRPKGEGSAAEALECAKILMQSSAASTDSESEKVGDSSPKSSSALGREFLKTIGKTGVAEVGKIDKTAPRPLEKLDVSCSDHINQTALFFACNYNDRTDLVKYLIKMGSNAHHIDKNGDTCLCYAARHGNIDTVKVCIRECGVRLSVHEGPKDGLLGNAIAAINAPKAGLDHRRDSLNSKRRAQSSLFSVPQRNSWPGSNTVHLDNRGRHWKLSRRGPLSYAFKSHQWDFISEMLRWYPWSMAEDSLQGPPPIAVEKKIDIETCEATQKSDDGDGMALSGILEDVDNRQTDEKRRKVEEKKNVLDLGRHFSNKPAPPGKIRKTWGNKGFFYGSQLIDFEEVSKLMRHGLKKSRRDNSESPPRYRGNNISDTTRGKGNEPRRSRKIVLRKPSMLNENARKVNDGKSNTRKLNIDRMLSSHNGGFTLAHMSSSSMLSSAMSLSSMDHTSARRTNVEQLRGSSRDNDHGLWIPDESAFDDEYSHASSEEGVVGNGRRNRRLRLDGEEAWEPGQKNDPRKGPKKRGRPPKGEVSNAQLKRRKVTNSAIRSSALRQPRQSGSQAARILPKDSHSLHNSQFAGVAGFVPPPPAFQQIPFGMYGDQSMQVHQGSLYLGQSAPNFVLGHNDATSLFQNLHNGSLQGRTGFPYTFFPVEGNSSSAKPAGIVESLESLPTDRTEIIRENAGAAPTPINHTTTVTPDAPVSNTRQTNRAKSHKKGTGSKKTDGAPKG